MLNDIADKGYAFLRQAASNWQFIGPALSLLVPSQFDTDPAAACVSLQHDLNLSAFNATILSASYHHNATELSTLGSCQAATQISVPLCRVQLVVNTSDVSAITAEAWFPTDWNGRFLGLGNGGLGGCIDYDNLGYGTSFGFATIGTNNGHDGNTGVPFANNTEVLADFTSRSVHVEAVVGKRLVGAYYGRQSHHAYYLGCSTGGRQGVYSAVHHPEDFDGILAGAPATNFNHLQGWSAILTKYIGAPYPETSASFIPRALWDVVAAEVLRQCDALDGVADGIISEPDACEFRPEELLCITDNASDCLTVTQVEALRNIYSPLYGPNNEILFPRFDPGAELSSLAQKVLFSGLPFLYSDHWMKYAIRNDSSYEYSAIGLADIALADKLDPGRISTFSGDLSVFRARGGKLVSYHGRSDDVIPSGNAKSLYNRVSRTLSLPSASIDEFYRLFFVPGMGHCSGGAGAVVFGQDAKSIPKVPDEDQEGSIGKADNVLLELVDWVERGHAPDTITGVSTDGKSTRVHCRYPQKSVWNGSEYICTA
ncbi:hypothetical protein M0805_003154 [Coniferiporia weirii]|nr:hypothetical protein M0805_003154 [Coniferiporia weirii]